MLSHGQFPSIASSGMLPALKPPTPLRSPPSRTEPPSLTPDVVDSHQLVHVVCRQRFSPFETHIAPHAFPTMQSRSAEPAHITRAYQGRTLASLTIAYSLAPEEVFSSHA